MSDKELQVYLIKMLKDSRRGGDGATAGAASSQGPSANGSPHTGTGAAAEKLGARWGGSSGGVGDVANIGMLAVLQLGAEQRSRMLSLLVQRETQLLASEVRSHMPRQIWALYHDMHASLGQ